MRWGNNRARLIWHTDCSNLGVTHTTLKRMNMLRWFAFTAALILLFAMSAMAQDLFQAQWTYISEYPGNNPLTTTCLGSTPIPDGRLVRIFWDVDSDGPDLTDPQPTICDVPPMCEGGPATTVNFNEFTFNAGEWGLPTGYFFGTVYFTCYLIMPNPPRYYLRVYETDGTTVLWTSTTKTMTTGLQEINLLQSDWTCGAGGPQCLVRDEHE